MTNCPITPPPERFKQWEDDILNERDNVDHVLDCAWKDGFLAGADQQLEQCVAWLDGYEREGWAAEQMRSDCRPKLSSLKERALQAWAAVESGTDDQTAMAVIRRALEQLDD